MLQGLACQHGPEECRLNRIFACAIDESKTPKEYWPFVECVESNYGSKIEDSLEGCATDNGFKLKDLEACASGMYSPRGLQDICARLITLSRSRGGS